MEYPTIENGKDFVLVKIKLQGQKQWRSGMFYRNGTRPTFSSYGTDVTERVEQWEREEL